jgi:CBS domain-containing protein
MSLMVTFNGQFKPYRIPPKSNDNVHRIRGMAPSFNDLIEHYVDKDSPERQVKDGKERSKEKSKEINQNKNKISSYIETQKTKKRKVYARDIMSTKIQTLSSKQTVADGMELLSKYEIHHLPIVDNNILVGIVSDRILLKFFGSKKSTSTTLNEIMVKEVLIGQEHSSISDIARVMLEERIHCIPITTSDLELKGLVTSSDILELLVHSFPLEIYA